MKRKHLKISLFICIWGIIFFGFTEEALRKSVQTFNTGWLDVVQAVFTGVVIGFFLRIQVIREFIDKMPFGFLTTGVALGIIGLGFIGVGLIGASIIYIRFEEIELIRLPLHASVVGLAAYSIYLTAHWGEVQ